MLKGFIMIFKTHSPVVSRHGRDSGRRGRWFESSHPDKAHLYCWQGWVFLNQTKKNNMLAHRICIVLFTFSKKA